MTSFARASSGLSDVQTLHLFHRLLREGREQSATPPPPQELARWRTEIQTEVLENSGILDAQRRRILQRLEALPATFEPDGPTFHAWEHIERTAGSASQELRGIYSALAARRGVEEDAEIMRMRVGSITNWANNFQQRDEAANWRPPTDFMAQLGREFPEANNLANLPHDNRTLYALHRLLEEYPAVLPTQAAPVVEAAVPTNSPAPSTNRCPNCGQSINEAGHDCPAEVVVTHRVGNQTVRQPMGEMVGTEEGRRSLNALAETRSRRGQDIVINGRNYSEMARTLLAGREALAAEQLGEAVTTQAEPVRPPATTTLTRCLNCGQFTSEAAHTCPAETVLRIGRFQGQNLGEVLETEEGRSYLGWLADSAQHRGGSDVVQRLGQSGEINYSELARTLLAGRAALEAEQAIATAAATPPQVTAPAQPPAQLVTPGRAINWVRSAQQVRRGLTEQQQAQLRVARLEATTAAARPRPEATPAPRLSGPEGQAAYEAMVAEVKAARTAGSGPPYETEAVLGDAATSFGVELEFKGANTDAVARKLYEMGIAGHPNMVAYHHSCSQCQGKWKVERDGSVTEVRNGQNIGGEVVAPVLSDTPEHWQQLKLVADTIKELGGQCDQNTGQHVHIGTAAYNNEGGKYRNLALTVAATEDLLYRMSAPDQQHHRGLLRTDRPEYHYAQPIAPRVQQFLNKPAPALRTLLRAMRVYETAHDRVPWAH